MHSLGLLVPLFSRWLCLRGWGRSEFCPVPLGIHFPAVSALSSVSMAAQSRSERWSDADGCWLAGWQARGQELCTPRPWGHPAVAIPPAGHRASQECLRRYRRRRAPPAALSIFSPGSGYRLLPKAGKATSPLQAGRKRGGIRTGTRPMRFLWKE